MISREANQKRIGVGLQSGFSVHTRPMIFCQPLQNHRQIYLSSAQQPSYHYGLNKIQHNEVNKKESCFDRCKIRKIQREIFTFLEKPFSRILSGVVPVQDII